MMSLHVTHTNTRARLCCMDHAASSSANDQSTAHNEQGGARVRLPPPLVFLALIIAGVVLEMATGQLELTIARWPRLLAGGVLASAGLACVLAARAWFTRTGQHPAPWKPSPELVVRGIYRHTRNPMYLGLTVFQIGLGVALGNGWIAALAPLALLTVHVSAVRAEEAYLEEKFGQAYLRYKACVRRYV